MGMYYFVSDIHLGLNHLNPVERERRFAAFLYGLPGDTKAVYMLGDIFDFWYEYKNVIPRGFSRVLGAMASLADRGVKLYFFNGNHDIWTYSYLQDEIGVNMLKQPYIVDIEGKRFCLGHGDALGEGDKGYKLLRSVFYNRFLQILFSGIHPRWAFKLAHSWSRHNRLSRDISGQFGGENERIVKYAEEFNKKLPPGERVDYFIFGHYHYCTDYRLKNGGELFIMGEWIHTFDYLSYTAGNRPKRGYYSLNME